MAAFSSLPRAAQRAAFAKMSAADKAKKAPKPKAKTASTGTARKRLSTPATAPVLNPSAKGGGFTSAGRISREEAARIMFGDRGAAARLAKASKKK
ncbi:hypothetical protein [Saccharothrix sp. HUAS TT1]|uniref:hypothetical protein n=1 Tax=unclassified Saccharothrix TaxID=2593673 RepID=UPI00345C2BDC